MKTSTNSVIIRPAIDKDVPALVALENRCFETDRLNAAQCRRFIKGDTALMLVIENEQGIIACALTLFRKGSSFTRLYSIAVDPDQRGHGYAAILLQALESAVQQRGCNEVRLEVRYNNPHAIQLYTRLGYTPFGEYKKFFEDGADALRMLKKLGCWASPCEAQPTAEEISD